MAFADGAVNESAYRSKLKKLKKEEADLLRCHHNIGPGELSEIISLGIHIDMVKDVLSKDSLLVTDFGIIGELGDIFIPAGFNAFKEREGELTPSEMADKDTLLFEMTDMVIRAVDVPSGFRECADPRGKEEMIKRNQRAILQLFNIRIIVYPERVEIKGTIPTQILDKTDKEENKTAQIITSPSLGKGGGNKFSEGALAPSGFLTAIRKISYASAAAPLWDASYVG